MEQTVLIEPSINRSAVLSADGAYRYSLKRTWGEQDYCLFLMLNPSTADAVQDDPTIRRCMAFAEAWGYGGLIVCNLFPLRATDPKALYAHPEPQGPQNGEKNTLAVLNACGEANLIVCAWGVHGRLKNWGEMTRNGLTEHYPHRLFHLGLTKDGQPKHPLYLSGRLKPTLWE